MFVWIFHRVSGIALIFLLALQLVSGFFKTSTSKADWVTSIAGLHLSAWLVCLTVFLLSMHAMYGIRTIAMDLGVKGERLLFWICTLLGLALFITFMVLFLTLVATPVTAP